MADMSQTPANVKSGSGAITDLVKAGEAITQGQPVYLSITDGKYYQADANDSAKYNATAVALTPATTNEYFLIQTAGQMVLGATLTTGSIYVVSGNVGAIAPVADIASTWYPCIVGISITTSIVILVFKAGTAARP